MTDIFADYSIDDLRAEYAELTERWVDRYSSLSEDEHQRKRMLWRELLSRLDVEIPSCPVCARRKWHQSPGDPKECAFCGLELDRRHQRLIDEIDAAWEQIIVGGETDD